MIGQFWPCGPGGCGTVMALQLETVRLRCAENKVQEKNLLLSLLPPRDTACRHPTPFWLCDASPADLLHMKRTNSQKKNKPRNNPGNRFHKGSYRQRWEAHLRCMILQNREKNLYICSGHSLRLQCFNSIILNQANVRSKAQNREWRQETLAEARSWFHVFSPTPDNTSLLDK